MPAPRASSCCDSGYPVTTAGWGQEYHLPLHRSSSHIGEISLYNKPSQVLMAVGFSRGRKILQDHYVKRRRSKPGKEPLCGQVDIYSLIQGRERWAHVVTVYPNDGADNDYFGHSATLDKQLGTTLIVGAPYKDES